MTKRKDEPRYEPTPMFREAVRTALRVLGTDPDEAMYAKGFKDGAEHVLGRLEAAAHSALRPQETGELPDMSNEMKDTQTWWRVSGEKIEAREVVKVTPKTVLYLEPHWQEGKSPTERRGGRDTSWEHWFDSESAAVEYVRTSLVSKEQTAREAAGRYAAKLVAFNEAHPLPATVE